MRKLTDQEKIDIVSRYLNGESSLKLGKEYKVSKQSILCILRVRNINIRKRGKYGK